VTPGREGDIAGGLKAPLMAFINGKDVGWE
jgi:hypothetical protein